MDERVDREFVGRDMVVNVGSGQDSSMPVMLIMLVNGGESEVIWWDNGRAHGWLVDFWVDGCCHGFYVWVFVGMLASCVVWRVVGCKDQVEIKWRCWASFRTIWYIQSVKDIRQPTGISSRQNFVHVFQHKIAEHAKRKLNEFSSGPVQVDLSRDSRRQFWNSELPYCLTTTAIH